MADTSEKDSKSLLAISSIVILIVFLGLVYFLYNRASGGNSKVVFPAGINYTGNEEQAEQQQTRPKYDWEKLAASSDWTSYTSTKKQYSFQYPKELQPLIVPGDPNDAVTFDVTDTPAQNNLMALVETISSYNKTYVNNGEEFVKNYWKFFNGLKKLNEFEEYQSEKGLKGYRANYETKAGLITGDSYFFLLPESPDKILHIANIFPKGAETLFMRMLNTFSFDIPTPPQPTKAE